jgi:hypothetical protein
MRFAMRDKPSDPPGTHRVPTMQVHILPWYCISLGFHIDVKTPNIEIHLPFCFLRIGFCKTMLKKQKIFKISTFWDEEEDWEDFQSLG